MADLRASVFVASGIKHGLLHLAIDSCVALRKESLLNQRMTTPLAQWLLAARTKKNMSPNDAAAAIGVSRQALNQWEKGKTEPSTANLMKICKVYETTLPAPLGHPNEWKEPPPADASAEAFSREVHQREAAPEPTRSSWDTALMDIRHIQDIEEKPLRQFGEALANQVLSLAGKRLPDPLIRTIVKYAVEYFLSGKAAHDLLAREIQDHLSAANDRGETRVEREPREPDPSPPP